MILHLKANVLLALGSGMLLSLLVSYPIGFLAIRRRGIYFAMVTLAFAQMLYFIAFKWVSLTGGDDGLQGVPRPDFFGVSLTSELRMYYFILAVLFLAILFAYRFVSSPYGKALVSIRENEQRAQSIGFNPGAVQARGVRCIGHAFRPGGRPLLPLLQNFVPLHSMHWSLSGDVVMMTLLGGMGTLVGPLCGGFFIVLAREVLSTYTRLWALLMGISFIVIIMSFRRGIVGELKKKLMPVSR